MSEIKHVRSHDGRTGWISLHPIEAPKIEPARMFNLTTILTFSPYSLEKTHDTTLVHTVGGTLFIVRENHVNIMSTITSSSWSQWVEDTCPENCRT